jgi:hypothetical protein
LTGRFFQFQVQIEELEHKKLHTVQYPPDGHPGMSKAHFLKRCACSLYSSTCSACRLPLIYLIVVRVWRFPNGVCHSVALSRPIAGAVAALIARHGTLAGTRGTSSTRTTGAYHGVDRPQPAGVQRPPPLSRTQAF